ncbi:hypothetical protein Q4E93_20470 [Flavitalea sp. BT771]|uniref:hypothetical protein n=1 Tax=Flavitalea sp. BT771 TaxID=3063329 RepID=UPI0026E186C6|nr:hypothetical protein [Flavitalea sp. BT771]MDO6432995.1 hypothetical protein [Flavitalea sp. BT771]MDV6221729.1 hypothetical protein [Flavitalea sp. BT771]
MGNVVRSVRSASRSFLDWLHITLDAAVLILLLLVYYTLFTNSASDLADILLASLSVLVTIFSLTPAVNHLGNVKKTCAKVLFLVILVCIFLLGQAK